MGVIRTRTGFGVVIFSALLAVETCAESTPAETAVKPQSIASETSADSVAAQTASSVLPAKTSVQLFRHTSYPDAWTAAQESNRPILLYVTMPGCPHCDKMMDETYHLPHVKQMVSESFETVYVSRQTHSKLVKSLKVKWYPTTVLVSPNNKVVDIIEGFVDAKVFQRRLKVGLASAESSTQTR